MNPGDDREKRIADLERQLADAKASAGMDYSGPPPAFSPRVRFRDQSRFGLRRRNGKFLKADLLGAIAGAIGLVSGGAAALTASLPSSALWTSAIVCGGPNQLMVNTSHYSYKPNQSGTSVDFQCLTADGAHDASWLKITALQTLLVALVLGGALALVVLIRRVMRNPNTGAPFGMDGATRTAVQTILHDREHPSAVTLPVIPG